MKIHTLFLLLFFTYSCSTETEDKGTSENSPLTDSRAKPNLEKSKSGSDKIKLVPPQIEVSEVTETSITLNWFDPINWETEEGGARQPEFLVESSTNPKLDNLVISRRVTDDHTITFSDLKTDSTHHFRITAFPPSSDERFHPSDATTMSVQTSAYPSGLTGSFSVLPEMGKVHFSWSKAIQPGPLDYVIHILTDPSEAIPYQEIITRDTEVRDLVLPAGQSYWAMFRIAPAQDNDSFTTTEEITVQFEVPGNYLPAPENLTAIDRNGTLEVQWTPISENISDIAYMTNVKYGDQFDQPYGDFVEKEPKLFLEDAKQCGKFLIEVKAIPLGGNFVDFESPKTSLFFEYPTVVCPTPHSTEFKRGTDSPSDLLISLASIGNTPSGHRYEIEVANDEEFTVGLDTRMIEGKDLSTTMTGRLPEEEHFIRIRMLGPQDDATVIASTWSEIIRVPAQAKPPEKVLPLP